jgi:hypothetical protein
VRRGGLDGDAALTLEVHGVHGGAHAVLAPQAPLLMRSTRLGFREGRRLRCIIRRLHCRC